MSVSFSLDTVLTAIALAGVFQVVVFAIVASGVPIVGMAESMACFFERSQRCEVFGLFVLLLVGIMLMIRSGHPMLFGCEVDFMSMTIFYFVPFMAMLADVVQKRCQCKIRAQVASRSASHLAAAQ